MDASLLATKLHIPSVRSELVSRPRLTGRLDEGLERKLTLVSAPAGFGKTTLLSEWAARCRWLEPKVRIAWVSLDAGDNDPARFLSYLIAALQPIQANVGAGALGLLQSPHLPPMELVLTALINEVLAPQDRLTGLKDRPVPKEVPSPDRETVRQSLNPSSPPTCSSFPWTTNGVGTVKAHITAIYRELDVRGRARAAIRARELNLL